MENDYRLLSTHTSSSAFNASGNATPSKRSLPSSAFGAAEDEDALHPMSKSEAYVLGWDHGVVRCCCSCGTTTQVGSSTVVAEDEAVKDAPADAPEDETIYCSANRQRHELTPEVIEERRLSA